MNPPHKLRKGLWVFPPNNNCHGGTSWWLDCDPEPVLIDCPPVNQEIIDSLERLSSGRSARILLTNREAHGNIKSIQDVFGWPVLLQEQEAYLLPGLKGLETFSEEHITASGLRLLWTPGPTPGSCVVYAPAPWNVLFCGRLLIPTNSNQLASLRTPRTFHWTRQAKSLSKLREWLPSDALPSLASGASLRAFGDQKIVEWEAWQEL